MNHIESINLEIDNIEKKENLEEKSELIKVVKEKIKNEQEKIDKMIVKVSENKAKKYKKYKGISIESLIEMFNVEENIDNKIEIYQQMNYLIESIKNELFEEND